MSPELGALLFLETTMRTRVSESSRVAWSLAVAFCLTLLVIGAWQLGGGQPAEEAHPAHQEPMLSDDLGNVGVSPTPLASRRVQLQGSSMEEGTQLYRGTVVWARGREEGEPCLMSGTARVALFAADSLAAPVAMQIRNGAWSIHAPPGSSLEVHRVDLDGGVYWPASISVPLLEGHETAIRIVAEPLMWFRDAESGEEIDKVSVQEFTHHSLRHTGFLPHHGVFDPVDVPEPVDAPLRAEQFPQGVMGFTASSYCWAAIPDPARTSSVVRLARAGSVGIRMVGQDPRLVGCTVELVPDDGPASPAYSIVVGEVWPSYLLSKVRTGVYRLEIVKSAGTIAREPLFAEKITVEWNSTSNVDAVLAPDKRVTATPVVFIVTGDERAVEATRRLEVHPKRVLGGESESLILLKEGEVSVRKPGALEYEPRKLLPGEYRVDIEPMGWYEEIVVPEDALHLQEISLGMMQEYRLRLHDEEGAPLEADWAMVRSGRAESLSRVHMGGSSVTRNSNQITFETIEGPVMVSLSVPGYGYRRIHLDGLGQYDFDVVLYRPADVRIELQSRSSAFSMPESWWSGVRPLASSGEPVPALVEFLGSRVPGWHSGAVLHVESPGVLLLEIPPLPGNPEPARIALDAPAGPTRRVLDVDSGSWVD